MSIPPSLKPLANLSLKSHLNSPPFALPSSPIHLLLPKPTCPERSRITFTHYPTQILFQLISIRTPSIDSSYAVYRPVVAHLLGITYPNFLTASLTPYPMTISLFYPPLPVFLTALEHRPAQTRIHVIPSLPLKIPLTLMTSSRWSRRR